MNCYLLAMRMHSRPNSSWCRPTLCSHGTEEVAATQNTQTSSTARRARCSVQSSRPRIGWHTAMYRSTVKATVSQMDVLAASSHRSQVTARECASSSVRVSSVAH